MFTFIFLFRLNIRLGVPFRWFSNTNIESLSIISNPNGRMRVLGPGNYYDFSILSARCNFVVNKSNSLILVLAIEAVTSEDAGTYKCTVSNQGGEGSAEIRLTITTPIQVDIVPNVLSVHMGGSAEFRCVVTSNGLPIGLQHITWYLFIIYLLIPISGNASNFFSNRYKDGRQLPSSSRGDTLLITGEIKIQKRKMKKFILFL